MPLSKVIVVGAGPSGLLLSLLLSRAGISVELLEQSHTLDTNPRASHYMPESCQEFDRAGVLDEIRAQGFNPNGVSWRKLDESKTRLVSVRNPDPSPEEENKPPFRYRMVCLPLHRLGKILENALLSQPTAKIRYGYKVIDLGEDTGNKAAWVKVEISSPRHTQPDSKPPKTEVLSADYIIACDGANSTIRRHLFRASPDPFPGFTWDKQIVATNIYYDFSPYSYDDSQFVVDPQHWHMVAKIQPDGLYRVTYGEVSGGLTHDELQARLPDKFATILPGNPSPDQYNLVNFSPYKVHQRCVSRMRLGRFILAGDAAHLCNPFGGLGLTGGIADVGSLYEALLGIHGGKADDSILDIYDTERRRIWHEVIHPLSSANMKRLFEYRTAEEAMERDPFFKMLRGMEMGRTGQEQEQEQADSGEVTVGTEEENGQKASPGMPSLRYDMTQHYWK